MEFDYIQQDTWKRKEYFEHYFRRIPCTYSMTAKINISELRSHGEKIYPALLYGLSTVVNRREEFRMSVDEQGRPGIFSELHPCYTVFHKDSETFSNIWTEYSPDYGEFRRRYEEDMRLYGGREGLEAKPDTPVNSFPVSMIPWIGFEGFNLNLQKGYDYLIPIFTFGKYYQKGAEWYIPMAMQVHHAVCDGFHAGRFLNEFQSLIQNQWQRERYG